MSASEKQKTLSDDERALVGEVVRGLGMPGARSALGITGESLSRLVLGTPVRVGTLVLVRERLRALGVVEAA